MTSLELVNYRNWLIQRRNLMPPNPFCWTWIQTHLPDWFMTTAYEKTTGRFTEPIGPHPEQIRLLAYTAVGAGYRGLGYWSDRFLADSHMGRDRLLALALLNQEFRMLEPLLVDFQEAAAVDRDLAPLRSGRRPRDRQGRPRAAHLGRTRFAIRAAARVRLPAHHESADGAGELHGLGGLSRPLPLVCDPARSGRTRDQAGEISI